MRQVLIDLLKPLHAFSVENSVNPGTPDVNYVEGWLELKEIERWPAVATQPVLLRSEFTPQQRIFMRQRWAAGGHAYLLLKVGLEWLLFDGRTAHGQVGFVTRKELEGYSLAHWKKRPTFEELKRWLTGKRTKPKS